MSRNSHIKRQKKKASTQKRTVPHSSVRAQPPIPQSGSFETFAALCTYAKKYVYSITRMRQLNQGEAVFTTLGTGFLCGDARFITCAHVMKNKNTEHEPGDKYLLIQKDEFGNFHRALVGLELGESLFLYPAIDAAILYLPDSFYEVEGTVVKDRSSFLQLSANNHSLGTEVGVFGYPLQQLGTNGDEIDMSPITIRADRGVLNSGNHVDGININEFTMAFNPGNSGGPIINCHTGSVIAFVRGYNSIPTKFVKEDIPPSQRRVLGADSVITAVRALYSIGICTTNLKQVGAQHNIRFY